MAGMGWKPRLFLGARLLWLSKLPFKMYVIIPIVLEEKKWLSKNSSKGKG
jgi:hypothetical protein